jgi:hypothetical protein
MERCTDGMCVCMFDPFIYMLQFSFSERTELTIATFVKQRSNSIHQDFITTQPPVLCKRII